MNELTSSNPSLQPIPFYDDTVFIIDHHGEPFVPVRPLCENMGLAWGAQFVKIKAKSDRLTVSIIETVAEDGKQREMVCIHLKKIFTWLNSINPEKVAPHLKEKIKLYQKECDEVLWNYWTKGVGLPDRKLANMSVVDTDELVQLYRYKAEYYRVLAENPAKRRWFSDKENSQTVEMYRLGHSFREIGQSIGRPTESIRSALRRMGEI